MLTMHACWRCMILHDNDMEKLASTGLQAGRGSPRHLPPRGREQVTPASLKLQEPPWPPTMNLVRNSGKSTILSPLASISTNTASSSCGHEQYIGAQEVST